MLALAKDRSFGLDGLNYIDPSFKFLKLNYSQAKSNSDTRISLLSCHAKGMSIQFRALKRTIDTLHKELMNYVPRNKDEYRELRILNDDAIRLKQSLCPIYEGIKSIDSLGILDALSKSVVDLIDTVTAIQKTFKKNIDKAAPKGEDGRLFKAVDPDWAWENRSKAYEYLL